MATKDDVLYNQGTAFAAHLARHEYKYLPGKSQLTDLTRRRDRASTQGALYTHYRVDDGAIATSSAALPEFSLSTETLDVSCGRDKLGNWIGGPFATHDVWMKREPTSWWTGPKFRNLKIYQPPAEFYHMDRYLPPFLSAPPTKLLRFYNPYDASPACISLAISQALGKLQGARNRARPDSTYADFAVSIAELREISQLVKLRGSNLASLMGSTLLAIEFGWKPIISDAKKLANMAASVRKRLDFLRKNVGKPVKRKRLLYKFTESHGQVSELTFGTPYTYHSVEPKEGTYPVYGLCEYEAWYHSVLTYDFLEDPKKTPKWDESAFRYFIGLNLDGSTLWEATPWTWLIDWFTNVGDFVEDRFATRLVDTHRIEEWITIKCKFTQRVTIPTVAGAVSSPDVPWTDAHSERIDTFKYRMIPPDVAPLEYVNLVPFTDKQQAILAALATIYLDRKP